jgi:hypothetical protein
MDNLLFIIPSGKVANHLTCIPKLNLGMHSGWFPSSDWGPKEIKNALPEQGITV